MTQCIHHKLCISRKECVYSNPTLCNYYEESPLNAIEKNTKEILEFVNGDTTLFEKLFGPSAGKQVAIIMLEWFLKEIDTARKKSKKG